MRAQMLLRFGTECTVLCCRGVRFSTRCCLNASEIDPSTLVKPVWATSWTADIYYEVLIGPKSDPFCFSVIPGNSSEGDLCYRADYGQQYYDMEEAEALRYDLNMKSVVGNITSTIVHQGRNFWM